MSEDGEFKIKGAAESSQIASESSPTSEDNRPSSVLSDATQEAGESNQDLEDGEVEEKQPTHEELLGKYKWFKCEADAATYGENQHYYIHADTQESRWTEPEEPYWIYDPNTGLADSVGLQHPAEVKPPVAGVAEATNVDEDYMGYNPKIHGDYDPNADYAQWHNKKRVEEAIAADPNSQLAQAGISSYESVMTLNRFTGNSQAAGVDPDRHSDAAKSTRQMSAFFDVDAAANAHEGRSLKEERKAQKLSKDQVKAFNQARHDKKLKKRLAFYKS